MLFTTNISQIFETAKKNAPDFGWSIREKFQYVKVSVQFKFKHLKNLYFGFKTGSKNTFLQNIVFQCFEFLFFVPGF